MNVKELIEYLESNFNGKETVWIDLNSVITNKDEGLNSYLIESVTKDSDGYCVISLFGETFEKQVSDYKESNKSFKINTEEPLTETLKDKIIKYLRPYGYLLSKKPVLPKIHQCTCGKKTFGRQYGNNNKIRIHCNRCEKVGPWGRNEKEAREKWNESMPLLKEGNDETI